MLERVCSERAKDEPVASAMMNTKRNRQLRHNTPKLGYRLSDGKKTSQVGDVRILCGKNSYSKNRKSCSNSEFTVCTHGSGAKIEQEIRRNYLTVCLRVL